MAVQVSLVCMPYSPLERPALGLSLLKAALTKVGITSRVHYTSFTFAKEIGLHYYEWLQKGPPETLLREWTFATAAFPDHRPDEQAYFDLLRRPGSGTEHLLGENADPTVDLKAAICTAREAAPGFTDRVANQVLAERPRVVGCSTTFQGTCPSLALLARVKQRDPSIITVMGGASCEGPMGRQIVASFPWVDVVVSGEADTLFPELCAHVIETGQLPDPLPHGAMSARKLPPIAPRCTVNDLDSTPVPDFDDYFQALKASPYRRYITPGLPVETSRGCWWGAKHHCTFCGLNGSGMGFRSKSPSRVVAEFKALSERYGIKHLSVVDNILDMQHITTVLPLIEAEGYRIFYETKSNLKEKQLDQLARSGVFWIQPGLESMHDAVLELMDKGNTAAMNIQLLKWCQERSMRVVWNFLYAFPHEHDEHYQEMADWMDQITHLGPPDAILRIRYDRFSPYHFDAQRHGVTLKPFETYAHVFPLPPEELNELACFFEDTGTPPPGRVPIEEEATLRPGLTALREKLDGWIGKQAGLTMRDDGEKLAIWDRRACATAAYQELDGLFRRVVLETRKAVTLSALARAFPEENLEPVLHDLKQRKLLLEVSGRLISLPVYESTTPMSGHFPAGEVRTHDYRRRIRA